MSRRKSTNDPLSGVFTRGGSTQNSNSGRVTTGLPEGAIDPTIIQDLLGNQKEIYSFGAGVLGQNNNQPYESQLLSLLSYLNNLGGDVSPEMQKQLYEMLLTLYQAREQRTYDKDVLNEQRLYDSPMSQMLRLMSTGMSRDAAIQALTGGQDPALVGSGADAQAPQAYGPTDIRAQQLQAAQTAFSGLSAIGSLVSMGFSIPQAIQQTDLLKAQNFLTQDQLKKYNAVNQVFGALNSVIATGGDAATAIGEIHNANDARDYINNNKDMAQFAPLFADGSFNDTFGSLVGREFFNNGWSQNLRGKTEGDRLDNAIRKEMYDTKFAQYSADKLQEEFNLFVETYDEQIAILENQVREGNKRILLLGEELQLKRNEVWHSDTQRSITEEFYDTEVDGQKVKHHIAMNSVYQLYSQLLMNQVKLGTPQARERFIATCNADANFALTMVTLKELMSGSIQRNNVDSGTTNISDMAVLNLGILLSSSGLLDCITIKDAADTGANVLEKGVTILNKFL